MNILSLLLLIVLAPVVFAFTYWIWSSVTGLVQALAAFIGYGMGRFLHIKPRTTVDTGFWVFIALVINIIISVSFGIWMLSNVLSWFFVADWINNIVLYSSTIWFVSLVVDFFVLIIVSMFFGSFSTNTNDMNIEGSI